jgi:23S rRNA pseudouridine1911/1915/1917 synthase
VLYADSDLLVIDKPAGLVVHPAAGNPAGTLLNALLHYDPALADLPRAGIVHRLDKATSGVLVVARNLTAHKSLVDALQARRVKREYLAVVQTVLTAGGSVDAPIGRHPVDRKRMAVVPGGKESLTHYRVEERFRAHTLVRVQLETGRTHQIRVHMAHQHIPILGDPVYGGRLRLPPGAGSELQAQLTGFRRQALHAARLTLTHPSSGETVSWSAPLPADMTRLLETLRTDARQHAPA